MKTKMNKPSIGRLLAVMSTSLILAGGVATASAADKTWDGGGDGVNWSASPANWVGDVAPVANDQLFFAGTGAALNNDFAANTVFNAITFANGAGAFTLGGSTVKLGGGVTNLSTTGQAISFAIDNNGANRVYNAQAGNIALFGKITGNNIIKEGANALVLFGTVGNSSDGAIVNNGLLIASNTVGNTFGAPITINTNGTLRLAGANQDQIHFNQRVTINGGVLQIQTGKEEIAALSGTNTTTGVVENGSAAITPGLLQIGGGSGHRGIYSGLIRDGAAGQINVQVYRNNIQQFNGTNTYTGTTIVQGSTAAGGSPLINGSMLIMNGVHTGGGAYTVSGASSTQQGILGGRGIISASMVNLNANSFLSPGGALSADGTDSVSFSDTTAILTFSNAVNLTTATSTLQVQLNGTTVGSDYDQVNIAGTGSFSNNAANLKLTLGYTPATGDKFTLVKVQGTDPASNIGTFATLNGVAADLSQGATNTEPSSGKLFRISYQAEGSTFVAGGNDIMIEFVAPAVAGKNVAWNGDGLNNNWDTATANWSTNGPSLTTYADGDLVTFNDAGSNNVPVNIVSPVTPGSLLIDATKNYEFAGAGFTGVVVMTKTNTGTLVITADNNNTGATLVKQGALQFGTNGTTGSWSPSATLDIAANGTVVHRRSDDVGLTVAFSGTGAFVHDGSGVLLVTNSVPFTGHVTNSGGALQLGDGVTFDGSIAGDINVTSGSTVHYLAKSSSINLINTLSGTGTALYDAPAFSLRTYTTTGSLISSNFAGTNIVAANVILHAADNNAGYALGNGGEVQVTAGGNQVWLDRSATPYNQSFVLAGDASPNSTFGVMRIFGCTVSGPVTLAGDTTIGGSINGGTISGPISGGSYQLTINGGANSFYLSLSNSANTWGNTLVTSGGIRALGPNSISTNAMTIDINGELNVYGNTVSVNSLANGGSGAGAVYNKSDATNGTLVVGADGSSSAFDGVFGDGASAPLSLTKVGAGTLTLSGVSTNTGTVAVNGGTLALTGSGSFNNAAVIAAGAGATYDVTSTGNPLTLNSGQTLKGSGTLNGSLTANANSTINPGDTIGALTITGNASLSGILLMELNRTNSPATNDTLVVNGTLTPGGTLQVVNVGPALNAGDKFYLFSSGISGFTVKLPVIDANGMTYTWATNITSDGSIQVLTAAPAIANSLFRSVANGNWSDVSIWQQSSNGVNWVAALGAPDYTCSNIVIQTGTTVTNTANVTADQLTVQTGAGLLIAGGSFNLNNGTEADDVLVAGTLEIGAGVGVLNVGAAGLTITNGGSFNWNRAGVPVIPTAVWRDGSTCRVSAMATGYCTGISGQSFYDFIWDTTVAGQSSRGRLNIQGTNTVIRRDFTVTVPNTSGASVTINNETNGVLTVGRNVALNGGTASSGIKILLNNLGGNTYVFKVGGNLAVTGYIDGFGSSSTGFEFNGAGAQTLTLPASAFLITSSTMNWLVDAGSSVTFASSIEGFNTFTNNGTLNFGGNAITVGGTLALNAGGTVNGNGTNKLVSGISAIVNGGTLNLGSLPAFAGGESFTLFSAGAYSGTFGTLLPATPDGTHTWVTTQLNTAGILAVSGGTPVSTNITFTQISSTQIVLDWPAGQGWKLEAQTNSLTTGLGTNWVEITGATPPYTNSMNSANGSVFFRLKY